MGNNYGNVLLVTPGRLALLIQDGHLPVRDQPPVLHRPRAEVRDCNHVLLGQGERGVEVVLVVGQDLGSDLRGPLGLVVTALQKKKVKDGTRLGNVSSPLETICETLPHCQSAERVIEFGDGNERRCQTSDFRKTKSETTKARR